ncbi:hypothetical protein CHLRE_09g404903v5 [Chlamydomonas reinhardtii]|uniref:Uncharacterized protein n=1 Tax=Chlamydomonas reinhardtii TaxID=3055 RepID=A0A2K3DCJ5_CHLRE|nr:uncharacterized protein CHLRE_09g404903v5 [Chlamydomonas reinhardtii]PNW78254.1 hypothetical protein CHLRE_09g404903v5 [Chlamydomonas reinhardtii]
MVPQGRTDRSYSKTAFLLEEAPLEHNVRLKAVKQIQRADAYYRSDIGWRAVERLRAGKH